MRYLFLFCMLVAVGLPARPGRAQALDNSFAAVNGLYGVGYVTALGPAQADGKRLVACGATRLNGSPLSSQLVRLDANGVPDQAFLQNVGRADAPSRIRGLANGQYLLQSPGGTFTVGGLTRNLLLRLNANGTADAGFNIGSGPEQGTSLGYVTDYTALADGKILVGGVFDRFGGQAAYSVVRLFSNGSVDGSFSAGTGGSANQYNGVSSLAVLADGKILVGGSFTQFNGQAANALVRLLANGSLDPTFTSPLAAHDEVSGLLVQPDGNVLVSGILHRGSRRTTLVRLRPTGNFDPAFTLSPVLTDYVEAYGPERPMQLQPDGRIVVIGSFDVPGYRRVARLTADGSLDFTFQVALGPDQPAITLALQPGGGILLGGRFAVGTAETALMQLAADGSLVAGYAPRFQLPGWLQALARQADGTLLVGGDFNEWNGQPVHRVVRLSADGVLDPGYGAGSPAFSQQVQTLLVQADGKLLVGCQDGLFRLLADGSPDPGFTYPAVATPYIFIAALTQQADGKLLVLGDLGASAGGGPAYQQVVRLALSGTFDPSFAAPALPQSVATALLVQRDGRIVLGTRNDNASTATLRRYEATGAVDASFAAPVFAHPFDTPEITTLSQQADSRLLVGGLFARVGAVMQAHVARLTATGGLDPDFAPGTLLASGNVVSALTQQPNGRVLVGGDLLVSQAGATYRNLLRLLPTGTLDASFAPTANPAGAVNTILVQPGGGIVLQGPFTAINSQPRFNLARLTAPGVLAVAAPAAVAAATTAWPVPAHDALRVLPAPTAHPQQAELLDALGRVVQQRALAGPGEFGFDVQGLPAGLYVLRVRYAEGNVARSVSLD